MIEFVFTTMTNSFLRILGEFEDTKQYFLNYQTFKRNEDGATVFLK